jgi:hypothetical protein
MTPQSPRPPARPSSAPLLAIVGAAVGLLLGWVGGGVGPRRELATAQADLDRARDELVKAQRTTARRNGFGAGLLPGMDELLGGGAAEPAPGAPAGPPPPGAEGGVPGVVVDVPPEAGAEAGAAAGAPSPAELVSSFNQAAEVQAVRAAQTRAAIAEQAELTEEEQGELDAVVTKLEGKLAEHADELIDLALEGDRPPTADALRLTHEITGALYEAQAGMEDLIGAERLEGVDAEALQIWNLVEVEAMRPAVERAAAELAAEGQP